MTTVTSTASTRTGALRGASRSATPSVTAVSNAARTGPTDDAEYRPDQPRLSIAGQPARNVASIHQVEAWYDEHADCLLSLAYRMLGDKDLAEAVVVEVFVIAHQTGGSWRHDRCGQRLVQLTRHRAGSDLRQRREQGTPRRSVGVVAPEWPLSELDRQQRELVEAACFEGHSADELAVRFNLSTRDVATSLHGAMLELGQLVSGDKAGIR